MITIELSGGATFLGMDPLGVLTAVGDRLVQRMAERVLAAAAPKIPVDDTGSGGAGSILGSGSAAGGRVTYTAPHVMFVHGFWDSAAPRTVPHWPPFGPGTALAGWAERHGIPPFLVARAIARNGTALTPFLRQALEEELSNFAKDREQAIEEIKQLMGLL